MLLKTLLDRPLNNTKIAVFEKMLRELSPYLTAEEIDKCVDFMWTVENSKFDINPTPTDCKTQFQIMLGSDRYQELVLLWGKKNQKVLSVFGKLKYKRKDGSDNTLYDGLDPEDNPEDWEKLYV